MTQAFKKLKNIAVVAHVDHGKTTLVDGLLKQSMGVQDREQISERAMDSGELEKERGITIRAKNCAIYWKDCKINLLDTPGHADFGGEVERSLMMVDGVLLLVDAAEGPLPQTRFVLQKALEAGIKIGVVINKVDRSDARIDEVKVFIEDLLLELATMLEVPDFDIDIPFLYASGRSGWCSLKQDVQTTNLHDLLDFMVSDYYHEPRVSDGDGLQLLVTNLTYSTYLGQQVVGRIQRGKIRKNQSFTLVQKGGKTKNFKITNVQIYDRLSTSEIDEAGPGEIVIVAGISDADIGDSLCSLDKVEPLTRIEVEPPTVAVNVSVNTSPLSGKEGEYLTSRRLEEFLLDAVRHNVSLRYENTDDPKIFKLKGRGELQLAIVFEELRRKGFEFMVSRPEVIYVTGDDGVKMEPYEKVVMDLPQVATGAITEKLSQRKGIMEAMMPISDDRTRLEFIIPSRGLIGYRSQFLTDTRGEGIMSSEYLGYRPYAGDMLSRTNGALIASSSGKITGYALFNLLNNGKLFVLPGEQCYAGQVVGEHNKQNDLTINAVREKQLTNVRTAGKDENIILPPVPPRSLEWAMDWIDDDELVEVTPENVRVRKKELEANKRSVIRK